MLRRNLSILLQVVAQFCCAYGNSQEKSSLFLALQGDGILLFLLACADVGEWYCWGSPHAAVLFTVLREAAGSGLLHPPEEWFPR